MVGPRRPFIGLSPGSPYGQFPAAAAGFFPDLALLLLYLPFDGTNGGTTFTDESDYGHTVVRATGNAALSTTNPKWGSACLANADLLASRLDAQSLTSHLPSNNWTAGGWARRDGACRYFGLMRGGASHYILMRTPEANSGNYELMYNDGGSTHGFTTSVFPVGTWVHWEVSRQLVGATPYIRLFMNGVLESETTLSSNSWPTGDVQLGRTDPAGFSGMFGAVDDVYLYAECLHTTDFTPPAGPLRPP